MGLRCHFHENNSEQGQTLRNHFCVCRFDGFFCETDWRQVAILTFAKKLNQRICMRFVWLMFAQDVDLDLTCETVKTSRL